MQDIINPIDRALLKAELTKEKRLRSTNKSKNEIYIVTAHDSPNVMQEIGRLREVAFRYYGGGTGFPVDIDEYDTMEDAFPTRRSSDLGARKMSRSWGDTVSFAVQTLSSTRMVNRSWRPRTCLISQRNLSRRSFLIR